MNLGLTIAFICNGDNHDSFKNYNKFGDKFWDDGTNNNSKIGYYFAYYFRQKYVYIHRIVNILQSIERPPEMDWISDRQILCLSKRLCRFTWNEWINGIGLGAPYTPSYCMTKTNAWSQYDLSKKFKQFYFIGLTNKIEEKQVISNNIQFVIVSKDKVDTDLDREEQELIKQIEEIRKKRTIRELQKNLPKLREKQVNKLTNDVAELRRKIGEFEAQIAEFETQIAEKEKEQRETMLGINDNILVDKEFAQENGIR